MKSASVARGLVVRTVSGSLIVIAAWVGGAQAQTNFPGVSVPFIGALSAGPSGAAGYSLPIQVPPGLAGMEPKLELAYSSQSGNGLLGVGWSLSGLSTISRCPKVKVVDGEQLAVTLTSADRFCLDGQRLQVVGSPAQYGEVGAQYRTEMDGFSRIDAVGGTLADGPASFVVRTKAGLRMEYAEAVPVPGKTVRRAWALSKVQDVKGNFYSISYFNNVAQSTGDFLPDQISYLAHTSGIAARNTIKFTYEARPDVSVGYDAGEKVKQTRRLRIIEAFAGTSQVLVSRYYMAYLPLGPTGQSRLKSVTRCAVSYGVEECLAPLVFGWQDEARPVNHTFTDVPNAQLFAPGGFGSFENWYTQQGDINGDGRTDVVAVNINASQICYRSFLATGNGQFDSNSGCLTASFEGGMAQLADINGDGLADLVASVGVGTGMCLAYFPSLGNGKFADPPAQFLTCDGSGSFAGWRFVAVDINRDGRADLLGIYNNTVQVCQRPALARGDAFFTLGDTQCFNADYDRWVWNVADVNGDGKPDLVGTWLADGAVATPCTEVILGTGEAGQMVKLPSSRICNYGAVSAGMSPHVGDFNGDGKSDLLVAKAMSGQICFKFLLSNGADGFVAPDTGQSCVSDPRIADTSKILIADVDGDGRSDVIVHSKGGGGMYARAWLTRDAPGADYAGKIQLVQQPEMVFATSGYDGDWGINVGDFTGLGRMDLLASVAYSGGLPIRMAILPTERPLITRVDNLHAGVKLAPSHTVTYGVATDPTLYTKDSGAVYPVVDLLMPTQLVRSIVSDDGIGGFSTVTYAYEGLRADLGGRGMQGFRKTRETSQLTGTTISREFRQDWPFTGMVTKEETSIPGKGNSDVLKRTETRYAQTQGSVPNTVFVYADQSSEASWDLDGTALPTSTTTYVYNAYPDAQYGDLSQVTVVYSDGSSKVVDNTYNPPNVSSWILGRLSRAKVTHEPSTASTSSDGSGSSQTPPSSNICSLSATMSEVPYGGVNAITVSAPGYPQGAKVYWQGGLDGTGSLVGSGLPYGEDGFAGYVSTYYVSNTNPTSITQLLTLSAEIREPGLAPCPTNTIQVKLVWAKPTCDLVGSSISIPYNTSFSWTVSGTNLPPDAQFQWHGYKDGALQTDLGNANLGTSYYSNDNTSPSYVLYQRYVTVHSGGDQICATPSRFMTLQNPPQCVLSMGSNTIHPGENIVYNLSTPMFATGLPAGSQAYFYGKKNGVPDISGAGEYAGAAPGTYTYLYEQNRPDMAGVYERWIEVRNDQGARVCLSNSVTNSLMPPPVQCQMNVSTNTVAPAGSVTYAIEGTNFPNGASAYWYGWKNGQQDVMGELAGSVPFYRTYENRPDLPGYYQRYAVIRDANGANICTTNIVDVTYMPPAETPTPPTPSCQLSVSSNEIPPWGEITYHVDGQNLPGDAAAYWYGTKGGVQDAFGEYAGAMPVTVTHGNRPDLPGYYQRYAIIRNGSGAHLCTTNTVDVHFQ
ncbi:MAG: VCBS repeat-containing protein [Ramlibacter sp.]|nr:VCBS repeat-containing protein [Ramlibacter sp.]